MRLPWSSTTRPSPVRLNPARWISPTAEGGSASMKSQAARTGSAAPVLSALTTRLFTSSSSQQPVRRANAAKNSPSGIASSAQPM